MKIIKGFITLLIGSRGHLNLTIKLFKIINTVLLGLTILLSTVMSFLLLTLFNKKYLKKRYQNMYSSLINFFSKTETALNDNTSEKIVEKIIDFLKFILNRKHLTSVLYAAALLPQALQFSMKVHKKFPTISKDHYRIMVNNKFKENKLYAFLNS